MAEKCILFPCIFLRWLPRQLRVLHARADLADLKGLAKQAGELWAHHSTEDLVVALQQRLLEEEPAASVASVHGPPSQGDKAPHWKKKWGRKPPPKELTQSCDACVVAGPGSLAVRRRR